MKLSGHLTLQIIDEITGAIVQTIEQDNIITNMAYVEPSLVNSCYWTARNIFISNETATPVRSKTSIQCLGTAYQSVTQPGMQAFHNANPPYFVITQTLDSLATSRTFQTVGLTPDGPGQNVNTTVRPYAYLLLNQPCIQEINQVLLLTYRVTVEDVNLPNLLKVPHPRWLNLVCYNLVYNSGAIQNDTYLYNLVANSPLKEYNWKLLTIAPYLQDMIIDNAQTGNRYRGQDISWQGDQRTLFFRRKLYWDYYRSNQAGSNQANGRIINGVLCGYDYSLNTQAVEVDPYTTRSAFSSAQTYFTSNLQSAFSYSATPPDNTGPMFRPDNTASGTGVLTFSESPWTGTWPTIYRLKITESGPVGTAKYVLGVKQFTSFMSDSSFTYADTSRGFHPYVVSLNEPYPNAHGWQFASPILAIDDKFTVQYDMNGLSIIHQFTGQHFDFDSTTSPALPITNFRQIAIDAPRNLLYAACSATGLWKLDYTNKLAVVITRVSTTPTYAVDVDKDGVVYAVMNLATTVLSLTSSISSYATNLGFSTVGLSTNNWLNIYVNKIHPDTRIVISVRNNSNAGYTLKGCFVYWWSLANGNSTTNYTTNIFNSGEIQTTLAWANGSDNRFWTSDGILLSFNSNTAINPNVRMNPFNIEELVQTAHILPNALLKLDGSFLPRPSTSYAPNAVSQDVWGNLINIASTSPMYSPFNGVNIGSYNSGMSGIGRYVTLTNGISLSTKATAHIYNNGMNNDINKWLWYKWDGTNWIRAVTYNADTNTWTDTTGTATKTTTSSALPLLDGINIRFATGLTEPSFIVGEVYDQYVAKGILKTNDNYVYLEASTFYTQPVFSQITLTPTVIAAINNHGVVLNGAPGDTASSSAVSAIAINPLWHSTIPEYTIDVMYFTINGLPITTCFAETIETFIPTQAALTTGQIIVYRNGLIMCSPSDVGKTLAGYFSYVARSD